MTDEATETVQITDDSTEQDAADDQQIGPTDAEIKRLKAQCRGRDLPSAGTSAACALYRQGIIDGTPELETVLTYIRSAPKEDVMNVDGIGPTGYEALEEEAKTETSAEPDAMVPPDPVPRQRRNPEAPECPVCGSGTVQATPRPPKRSEHDASQASQLVYWKCLKDSDHGPIKTLRKGHASEFPSLNSCNPDAPKCPVCGWESVEVNALPPERSEHHPFQAFQEVHWECLKDSDHGPIKTIRKGHVSDFPRLNS